MSEFQREAGLAPQEKTNNSLSVSTYRRPEQSFMQQSLVASFMEQEDNLSLLGKSKSINIEKSQLKFDLTRPEMSFRGNATTGLGDISQKPAQLDLTKAPELEMTTHNATGLNDITKPANLELSGLELSKPELINDSYNNQEVDNASKIEDIELGVGNLSLREDLNPFDPEIHAKLLNMI